MAATWVCPPRFMRCEAHQRQRERPKQSLSEILVLGEGCKAPLNVSKEQLEDDWLNLLTMLEPTADALVNVIPQIAKTKWKQRQQAVSEQNRVLSARLEDQRTLNPNLIESKLRGELAQADLSR